MKFSASLLSYHDSLRNTILYYNIKLKPLKSEDFLFLWQSIGNYSLTVYEMILKRTPSSISCTMIYLLDFSLLCIGYGWWIHSYQQTLVGDLFLFQVSFLIPPEIVPGRMTLLVTIFLVLINIFNNVTSNSPNVEGLTEISSRFTLTAVLLNCYVWREQKKTRRK